LIKIEFMRKAQGNPVFTSPIGGCFFFTERRKGGRKAFKVTVLNGVIELGLEFVTDTKAAG
jgi:hypothetical protein